jgi:hypothetical protein
MFVWFSVRPALHNYTALPAQNVQRLPFADGSLDRMIGDLRFVIADW